MYDLHLLQTGYNCDSDESSSSEIFLAACTISLLVSPDFNILFDTGSPWDSAMLIAKLESIDKMPANINYVICSHGHADHVGCLSLFQSSVVVLGADMCEAPNKFNKAFNVKNEDYTVRENTFITFTPGHTNEDITLIAPISKSSLANSLPCVAQLFDSECIRVGFTGDLFENENDESTWKALSSDIERQLFHRERIRNLVDVIVPGHGSPFLASKICSEHS